MGKEMGWPSRSLQPCVNKPGLVLKTNREDLTAHAGIREYIISDLVSRVLCLLSEYISNLSASSGDLKYVMLS